MWPRSVQRPRGEFYAIGPIKPFSSLTEVKDRTNWKSVVCICGDIHTHRSMCIIRIRISMCCCSELATCPGCHPVFAQSQLEEAPAECRRKWLSKNKCWWFLENISLCKVTGGPVFDWLLSCVFILGGNEFPLRVKSLNVFLSKKLSSECLTWSAKKGIFFSILCSVWSVLSNEF